MNTSVANEREAFLKIYKMGAWGKEGPWHSGEGSTPSEYAPYIVIANKFIPFGSDVLDFGCGDGRVMSELAARRPDCRFVGYDCVPEILDRSRSRWPELEWTGQLQPFGEFDCILIKDVLMHLPNARILEILTDLVASQTPTLITNNKPVYQRKQNADIRTGECRPLDFSSPMFGGFPFSRHAEYGYKSCWVLNGRASN